MKITAKIKDSTVIVTGDIELSEVGPGFTITNATIVGLPWELQDLRGWDIEDALEKLKNFKRVPLYQRPPLERGEIIDDTDFPPLPIMTAGEDTGQESKEKHRSDVIETQEEIDERIDRIPADNSRGVNTTEDVPF